MLRDLKLQQTTSSRRLTVHRDSKFKGITRDSKLKVVFKDLNSQEISSSKSFQVERELKFKEITSSKLVQIP